MSDRVVFTWASILSASVMAFLVWLIYLKEGPAESSGVFAFLPAVNSAFNSLSALCVVTGWAAIRRGRRRAHIVAMSSALALSAAFLISYVIYHYVHGDTPFGGSGWTRPVYFSVLISHVLATMAALPMILVVIYYALGRRFSEHRRLARRTVPLWLYVSVTGVLIFVMLRAYA